MAAWQHGTLPYCHNAPGWPTAAEPGPGTPGAMGWANVALPGVHHAWYGMRASYEVPLSGGPKSSSSLVEQVLPPGAVLDALPGVEIFAFCRLLAQVAEQRQFLLQGA